MITFNKDLETGVSIIDEQHKELIQRLNIAVDLGVSSGMKDEIEKNLKFLEKYIIKHFGDEERLQIKCGYPKYEWHKQQHKSYINEFKKLKDEYQLNGASAKYIIALNNSIIKWIIKHIKSVDVELGKYCLSN